MPMIGAHRHLDAVEHEGLLADARARCRASPAPGWRRRRSNSSSTCSRYQRRNFCALTTQAARDHGAGDQPVAHGGIEVARACAQAVEMQRGALARGDDVGRGARPRRFGDLDLARGAERRGDARERGLRLRRTRRRGNSRRRRRCAGRRCRGSSSGVAGSAGRSAQTGSSRVVALHGVVGERQVARRSAPTARDDRGSRRTERCARATAGRRSA